MRYIGFLIVLVLFSIQNHAQGTLQLNAPVSGAINNAGRNFSWSFSGLRDDVYSFRVEGQDGFDPVLSIQLADGTEIIRNDDANGTDAILDAITLPQAGDYIAVVSGYGESTGGFTLTMLPGYSELELENFWEDSDDTLNLQAEGIQVTEEAIYPDTLQNFYAEVRVAEIEERNGWTINMILHQQTNGDHYTLSVNSNGTWRLSFTEGDQERVIRDWTPHPAIVPGTTEFTIGVMAYNSNFDVFYNDQLVGSVTDTTIEPSGQFGLSVTSANALNSSVNATFTDLIVTTPAELDGVPDQLIVGNSSLMIKELERRGLIPTGGQLLLNVAESFRESRNPGVQLQPLASGTTFTNFAMSTTVTLDTPTDTGISGCGLYIRYENDNNYMVAYLDSGGGYGVNQRYDNTFDTGIFAENPDWDVREPNQLLVIVQETTLHYYVNGLYVDSLEIEPVEGGVGNTIINFDPVDALCRFEDTWLWRW